MIFYHRLMEQPDRTTIDSFTFETRRADVKISPSRIVAVSPEDIDFEQWGVFQFPFLWKTEEKCLSGLPNSAPNDGFLQLQIHNGLDTKGRAGYQGRPFYYESADQGQSWYLIEEEAADFTPPALSISPESGQIRVGLFEKISIKPKER